MASLAIGFLGVFTCLFFRRRPSIWALEQSAQREKSQSLHKSE